LYSKEEISLALQKRKADNVLQNKKISFLSKANEKLLSESWKNNASAIDHFEQLLNLFEENKLSSFDHGFLTNWLGKKVKG